MKKLEIKGIGAVSAFKATAYMMIIPSVLLFVIGVVMMLIAAATGRSSIFGMGFPFFVMPIFLIVFYGAVNMLNTLLYGMFAKKFGGLELTVEEKGASDMMNGSTSHFYNQGTHSTNSGMLTKTTPPPISTVSPNRDQNNN
ncbi:hypothetical protein [Paenibacillus sp. KS-LC4]|uniref:hypothetical protein n=1 Tax=Paenibacillus sp. KS-LC4 TaxID=2979727 RepID=UPI0030CFE437